MADAVAKTSTPDAVAGNPIDVTTVATGAGTVDRQRVSIADASAANNATVSAAGALKVDGSAVTQPVSGTFFQATQPVSGAIDVTDRVARLVGHVNVDNFPATQPVSAVSLPLPTGASTAALQTQPGVDIGDVTINNAAGASAVNVQDGGNSLTVDGTVTTTPPANASTNVAQLAGTATSVNSGLKDAGTLRVVIATDQPQLTNKLLVTPDSVALPANQSVNVAQFGGTNVVTGAGAGGAGIPRVTVSNDSSLAANQSVNVNQVGGTAAAATAKGTQATNGIGVQNLKDSGRQQVMLSWEEMAGTAAAESALTNFTLGSRNATALTAATSYTVSAGKTLRIQSITVYLKSTSTAELLARFRIRQAASAIANNSPVIFDIVMSIPSATIAATEGDQLAIPIPDGLEVAATQQITFTWFTSANTSTVGISITGYEY